MEIGHKFFAGLVSEQEVRDATRECCMQTCDDSKLLLLGDLVSRFVEQGGSADSDTIKIAAKVTWGARCTPKELDSLDKLHTPPVNSPVLALDGLCQNAFTIVGYRWNLSAIPITTMNQKRREYTLSACGAPIDGLPCPAGTAVCQDYTPDRIIHSLGKASSSALTTDGMTLNITYSDGSYCDKTGNLRNITISYVCSQTQNVVWGPMTEDPLCQYRSQIQVPKEVCTPPATPPTTTGGSTTGGHKGYGDFCTSTGYVSSTNRVWDLRSMVVVLYYGLLGKTNYTVDLTVCASSLYTSMCGTNSVLCQMAIDPARNFTLAYRNTISAVQEDNDKQISVSYLGSGCEPVSANRQSVVTFVCDSNVLNAELVVGEPDKCTYTAKVKVPSYMCESGGPTTTGSITTGGSTTGQVCPAGFYVKSGNGCQPCPAGFFSSQPNSPTCYACAPGSTSTGSGSTSCTKCPAGFITNNSGQCVKCDLGTYGPSSGSPICYLCPPGLFGNQTGATNCARCPAGYYSMAGAFKCSRCPNGTYNPNSGGASCTVCPAGYESSDDLTTCTMCPADTYSKSMSSSCTKCPSGSSSAKGSFACFNPNA